MSLKTLQICPCEACEDHHSEVVSRWIDELAWSLVKQHFVKPTSKPGIAA